MTDAQRRSVTDPTVLQLLPLIPLATSVDVVGASTNFGQITNTRFPTGDSGSSRQMQFASKYKF